jgi:hypothetical protein
MGGEDAASPPMGGTEGGKRNPMTNPNQKPRTDPVILARARELRRAMTPQERKLWTVLRRKQLAGECPDR